MCMSKNTKYIYEKRKDVHFILIQHTSFACNLFMMNYMPITIPAEGKRVLESALMSFVWYCKGLSGLVNG